MNEDKRNSPDPLKAHQEGLEGTNDGSMFVPQSEENKQGMMEKQVLDEEEKREEEKKEK